MTNISIDLETLGIRPGCKILSIGAVEFSQNGLGREFYVTLSTADQDDLHEDPATLAWWAQQSPEARKVFGDAPMASFKDGLEQFAAWCPPKKLLYPWGNGADFDNAILAVAFYAAKIDLPWDFWNNRCYRTLKSLKGAPKLDRRVGTYHNALDDAKTQALHAVQILNALKLW